MDKRSRERHTEHQHRLVRVDASHLTNVTPIVRTYKLHQCKGHCQWRGWVEPE